MNFSFFVMCVTSIVFLLQTVRLHAYFIRTIYKNEAQICPKIKNTLRTIEARLQMQM